MKYVLVFALVGLVFWIWRSQRLRHKGQSDSHSNRKPAKSSPALAPATEIVACAFCHVHLPHPDAVVGAHGLYCSASHKNLAGD